MSDEIEKGTDHSEAEEDDAGGTRTLTRPKPKTKTPPMYKVLILNDDFTPRDFVVLVLQRFFKRTETDAIQLMLQVHHKGFGVAGVYSLEIAETKAMQVNDFSRENQYPLKCSVEKA